MINPLLKKLQELAARLDSTSETLDSFRVFHGRGKMYPGLEFVTLDYYHPVLLLTLFNQPPELWLNEILPLLQENISQKIQTEMTYPGQVKITVIRETRAVNYAK